MKVRRTRSIGFRLSMLVSLAIVIFGVTSIYMVVSREERMYKNQKIQQWETLINALIPNLANLLASNDARSIIHIMDRISSNREDLNHFFLCNERGEVVYSIDLKREGEKLSKGRAGRLAAGTRKDAESGNQIVQFASGIRSGTSRLGALYMGFTYLPSLEKEQMIKILTLEDAILNAIKKYLLDLDFYQVDFVTAEMLKDIEDIAYFEVVRENGTIVSNPDKEKMLKASEDEYDLNVLGEASIRKSVWTRKLTVDRKQILEVTLVVFDGRDKLGMIQIGHDLSTLNASIRRGKIILAAFGLFSTLLAVFIAMYIASRISGPVLRLVGVAREVGKGNLDAKAEVHSGGDEMRLLGGAFNEMVKGLKERDLVKDTFSRYVTKQVVDELLKDPGKIALGGKKQEVTILFSDIRGFTTFSEGHAPEEVVFHLNEYLSAMVNVIFKYEGTLDKFIGDAIMAIFGSPLTHEDDPLRAVKTALEMQEQLNHLNKKWRDEGKSPFKVGIGINTGDVIVGNIGDVRRMEYTVIGDNVNLASRIEGLTKNYNCPIIISESTYGKVKDRVRVNRLDAAMVKGKSQYIEIFELLELVS